jgi:hypothetical protein
VGVGDGYSRRIKKDEGGKMNEEEVGVSELTVFK